MVEKFCTFKVKIVKKPVNPQMMGMKALVKLLDYYQESKKYFASILMTKNTVT